MLDFIFVAFIIIIGILFVTTKKKLLYKDKRILIYLWFYHLFFSVLYYVYTRSSPADTNAYWRVAKNASKQDYSIYFENPLGTNFMYLINYFPSRILDLSIFTGTIIYSLFSFIGFYFFLKTLKFIIPFNSTLFGVKIFPFLLFLPNFHFWSVGAGKDALAFFSILALIYSILNVKNNKLLLILSSLLLFFVRPHVFFVFLLSFIVVSIIQKKNFSFKYKFIGLSLAMVLLTLLVPTILTYVNLTDMSDVEAVVSRADIQSNNLRGADVGSSVDTSSYPFLLKVFSFLYRPLFFDSSGLFSLLSSFENLVILSLSIKLLKSNFIKLLRIAPFIIKLNFYFFFLGTIMFSVSLSNLGIYLRMKNMLIPSFIIFILWTFSFKIKKKYHPKTNE